MSRRPGHSPRSAGCFLLLFFGVFAAFGLFFIVGISTSDNVKGDIWVGYVVSTVFLLVGLGGMYAGIRTLLGKPALRQKPEAGWVSNVAPGGGLPKIEPLSPKANGYYRIDPETSHKAQFILLILVAIFWNGIVALVLFREDADAPRWFMAISVGVGLLLLFLAVKAFFRWTMVGETHIDVDKYPVSPGQRLDILVSQPGNFKIDQIKIDLLCEERATYRRGTKSHTKTEVVHEVPVCDLPSMTAREGRVLAHQTAQIPPDAMVSFKARNNQISWLIRVKMVLPGRPDVEQKYPLMVLNGDVLQAARSNMATIRK